MQHLCVLPHNGFALMQNIFALPQDEYALMQNGFALPHNHFAAILKLHKLLIFNTFLMPAADFHGTIVESQSFHRR